MSDPEGPPTPAVYWRRRGVAVTGVIVVLLLGLWAIGALASGSDAPDVRGTANGDSAGSVALLTNRPSVPPSRPSSPPPISAAASSSSSSSAATSATSVRASSAAPPPPPQPCPDAAIKVLAQTAAGQYKVGQQPSFSVAVRNSGPVPCLRDLNRSLRELLVMTPDGAQRLWSSNDCYHGSQDGVRLLEPGKPVGFAVAWAGRTSAPGCPAKRTRVPAGAYVLIAKLGPLSSAPTPFALV